VIFIVVKHPVRPEYADQWPTLVEAFTEATRAEPGNISFDWYRSAEDPNEWLLVEAFTDGAAGGAHVASDHFQTAINRLPGWLTAVPEIVHVETAGTGWDRMSELQIEP
jgi:quinol monooxygenase YgiN